MTSPGVILPAVIDGLAHGLQFNPVTSLVGSGLAAALAGYPKAPGSRRPLAVAVLAVAWLAGDGAFIGRVLADGPASRALWAAMAAWVVSGALVGYAVPAAAGIGVGRRVEKGTGWLAAVAVALAIAGALAVVAPALAQGIRSLAGLG